MSVEFIDAMSKMDKHLKKCKKCKEKYVYAWELLEEIRNHFDPPKDITGILTEDMDALPKHFTKWERSK